MKGSRQRYLAAVAALAMALTPASAVQTALAEDFAPEGVIAENADKPEIVQAEPDNEAEEPEIRVTDTDEASEVFLGGTESADIFADGTEESAVTGEETAAVSAGSAYVLAAGVYDADVTSDNKMFKVVDCVLTSDGKAMTAVITMSGTGYTRLYMGTAAEAAAAEETSCIGFQTDESGRYTFTIPVEALLTQIPVAAYSLKNELWYDRNLLFELATDPVDNSVELADGEYTDRVDFTFSGGTGRTVFTCEKLEVRAGKACATIAIDSTNYKYIKAGGEKYEPEEIRDGKSYFTIPAALNADMKIVGMTEAMSNPREILYTIHIAVQADVSMTSVKITGAPAKLLAGKTVKLGTAVVPDGAKAAVTWSSSNKKYASVTAAGVVTAKAAGAGKTVTITATATDSTGVTKTDAVGIRITGAVKKITVTAPKTLKAGKKAALKTTVKVGKGGSKAVTYKSSNTKYAVVTAKGVVKAKKAGKGRTVTITVTAKDGSGVSKKVKIRIVR